MTTLNQITLRELPQLSPDNYVDNTKVVQQYIDVTHQAITRFVNGWFLISQSFKQTMHLPETPGLMEIAIQNNLLNPLSKVYKEFEDFQFEITQNGSMIGKSVNANTILSMICAVANAPVRDIVTDGTDENDEVKRFLDSNDLDNDEDWDEDDEDEDWDEDIDKIY